MSDRDSPATSAEQPRRRLPWRIGVITERRDGPLRPARAASRMTAYVYGNLLVLAAIAVADGGSIENGTAALVVLGTGLTTFVAHVFADFVGHAGLGGAHEAETYGLHARTGEAARREAAAERRQAGLEDLRDAVPIMSAATGPALLLGLGFHDLIPSEWAQLLAGLLIVVRIATIPLVTERLRGRRPTGRLLLAGLGLAALGLLVVLLKVLLAH